MISTGNLGCRSGVSAGCQEGGRSGGCYASGVSMLRHERDACRNQSSTSLTRIVR